MSLETDGQIYELQKSIDKLNENLTMIAFQLYYTSSMDTAPFKNEIIKNFIADKERLQKGG